MVGGARSWGFLRSSGRLFTNCPFGVFSETSTHPVASLCVRSGASPYNQLCLLRTSGGGLLQAELQEAAESGPAVTAAMITTTMDIAIRSMYRFAMR